MELNRHDLNWCVRKLPLLAIEMMQRQGSKVFVAGGFIRACIAGEPINDIDFFSPSKQVAEVLATEIGKGHKIHETPNAYTVIGATRIPLQFIHRWCFETPEQCVASFDFTIARAALWFVDKKVASYCDESFYQDLAGRRLIYCAPCRAEEAGGSLLRVLKFYQKGYRIPLDSFAATIARLVLAVDFDKVTGDNTEREAQLAKVLTGLLHEVDPNIDPEHLSHLPALKVEE